MMKVGLIDADNWNKPDKCFPNLALMKLSAWHKIQGDSVGWYDPMFTGHCDKVYMSKVFSFTPDYPFYINADEVVEGGTGYCINLVDGKEVYNKKMDTQLPYEVEHVMPDYNLYNITDTAYGFMTRGCPRGCEFCHVGCKEGLISHKVANLDEFWNGQKYIMLNDPNTFACKEWEDILGQLKESKANVEFNQGIDIRLMTEKKVEMLKDLKMKLIHFAFDRYEDKDIIIPKMQMLKEMTGWKRNKVSVYILCNFNTTLEQDLERIQICRDLDFSPYVMLYDKEHIPKGHEMRKLQRYVNNRICFWGFDSFEKYKKETYK